MKKHQEQIALVKAELEQLDDNALISAWNEYACDNCPDDQIFENDDDFFDTYFSKPQEAVRACYYGEYKYSDTYVKFNGLGNLDSFSSLDEDNIDFDALADYVWEKRLDCIDWDELEEEVTDEFRGWMKENGIDYEVAERFMDEEFDWENDFNEMLEEASKYE